MRKRDIISMKQNNGKRERKRRKEREKREGDEGIDGGRGQAMAGR